MVPNQKCQRPSFYSERQKHHPLVPGMSIQKFPKSYLHMGTLGSTDHCINFSLRILESYVLALPSLLPWWLHPNLQLFSLLSTGKASSIASALQKILNSFLKASSEHKQGNEYLRQHNTVNRVWRINIINMLNELPQILFGGRHGINK